VKFKAWLVATAVVLCAACGSMDDSDATTPGPPATDVGVAASLRTAPIDAASVTNPPAAAELDDGNSDHDDSDHGYLDDDGYPVPTTVVPPDATQTEIAAQFGISLDDPLPPQPDANSDPAGAEVAVRFAYEHWILVDLDAELRGSLLEGGEARATEMAAGLQRQRQALLGATISVEGLSFDGAEHARVTFWVNWYGTPSPYFQGVQTGDALLVDGSWRVSASTVCRLALTSGFACPLLDQDAYPTPPDALRVMAVPPGLHWTGPADLPDTIVLGAGPGPANEWVGDGEAWMSVWIVPRPGVSLLPAGEQDDLLLAVIGGTGIATTIGGRPARYVVSTELQPDNATEYFIATFRADDVLVQAMVSNVPVEVAVAALESMSPVEPVS